MLPPISFVNIGLFKVVVEFEFKISDIFSTLIILRGRPWVVLDLTGGLQGRPLDVLELTLEVRF